MSEAQNGGNVMERYSDRAIEIINELHTARIDYESEYIPLIDCANQCAAYEDTGLTPEEIDMDHEAAETLRQLCQGCDLDRLEKLAEADKAGRLVVLPCKVGNTLWVTGRDNVPREMELEAPDIRAVCTDEDNLCMSTCNRKPDGFCAYRLRNDGADIGKTVFLTREEAEKALEAKKDE